MLDFLRDQLWQFVGVAISVVSIVVSIIFSLKQRARKGLTYKIESTSLVSIKDKAKGKIQILYDLKPISDADLVLLKIWNSGNQPILQTDYEDPITFNFGSKTEILSHDVIETVPNNIKKKVSMRIDSNNLIINPLLLNAGYSIIIKLVLSKFEGEVNAETLIPGLNALQEAGSMISSKRHYKNIDFLYKQAFFVSPILIIFNALLSLSSSKDNVHTTLILICIMSISPILAGLAIISDIRLKHKFSQRINGLI